MTDNSNFVLIWDINNATAAHAAGKAESGVFSKGGFKWSASFKERDAIYDIDFIISRAILGSRGEFTLKCDVDHLRSWNCQAEVTLYGHRKDGSKWHCESELLLFDSDSSSVTLAHDVPWNFLTHPLLAVEDTFTVEFHINIVGSERFHTIADPDKFSVPNRKSNVILLIEDKKLHVSKEFLAVQSPVFDTMFFGDFAEKDKQEIEIKDVVYEEFLDFLHMLYSRELEITDRTVPHILQLSDRFEVECLMNDAEKHLAQTTGFDIVHKLMFADQYRLTYLKDRCLKSFSDSSDVIEQLKSFPDFANFSSDMKAAICERIVQI